MSKLNIEAVKIHTKEKADKDFEYRYHILFAVKKNFFVNNLYWGILETNDPSLNFKSLLDFFSSITKQEFLKSYLFGLYSIKKSDGYLTANKFKSSELAFYGEPKYWKNVPMMDKTE